MRGWPLFVGAIVVGLGPMSAYQAHADLLDFGTTYTIDWNFGTAPGNSTPNTATVTLSSSAQTFGSGAYQITEHTTALGGGAEFAEFFVTSASGAPLVANANTNGNGFAISVNNIQLTGNTTSSNYYFDFATNGAANTGITGSGGIQVEANPNPGSIGAGKSAFFFPGSGPSSGTTTGYAQFEFPTSIEFPAFNQDPNANGYFLGIQLTPASAVPEPSTWAMMLLGFAGLGFAFRRSRRKVSFA